MRDPGLTDTGYSNLAGYVRRHVDAKRWRVTPDGDNGLKIEAKEDPEAGLRSRLYALMAELAQFYHRCLLQAKEAEGARDYLRSRDLGGEVAAYAPPRWASFNSVRKFCIRTRRPRQRART